MKYPPATDRQKNLLDRIEGSLIGLAIGDALGAHVEFRPRHYLIEHPVVGYQAGGTWGLSKGQVFIHFLIFQMKLIHRKKKTILVY